MPRDKQISNPNESIDDNFFRRLHEVHGFGDYAVPAQPPETNIINQNKGQLTDKPMIRPKPKSYGS